MVDETNALPVTVLVVEDEPIIRRNLCHKITEAEMGFRVVASAKNGAEAMQLMTEIEPDLLITDIRMPGMDGLALIARAGVEHPRVMIAVVSGYDEFEYAREAMRHGVREYLLKPIDPAKLAEMLARVRAKVEAERGTVRALYAELRNIRDPKQVAESIRAYIAENFTKRLDLGRMARELNLNYSSMGKLFKRYMGSSPLRYLTNVRINEAKRLLSQNPDIDVAAIAQFVGYEDQGYFCRLFKQHTRESPSEFRKRCAASP